MSTEKNITSLVCWFVCFLSLNVFLFFFINHLKIKESYTWYKATFTQWYMCIYYEVVKNSSCYIDDSDPCIISLLWFWPVLSLLRGERHAEEGGRGRGLQPSRGDPSGRRAVLHQNLHHCAHHRDQLPHRQGVRRGDGGWEEVQGRLTKHEYHENDKLHSSDHVKSNVASR